MCLWSSLIALHHVKTVRCNLPSAMSYNGGYAHKGCTWKSSQMMLRCRTETLALYKRKSSPKRIM